MLKTDERIILAAMKVFSHYPIEDVTLRMIANEGDVTPSLITYHFKTKENLYQEVLSRFLSLLTQTVRTYFEGREPTTTPTSEAAEEALCDTIGFIADQMYNHPNAGLFAKIIIQEHFSPSQVYDMLYENFFKNIIDLMAGMIQAINGSTDQRRTNLQVFAIIGQLIGFRLERELLVRHIGMEGFSANEAEELKQLVIRNTLAQIRQDRDMRQNQEAS